MMIKKSLQAYNTRSQLEFCILPDGKVIRLFLLQILKHQIHRILEILIVLTDLHGVDKLDQCGKVLLLFRRFIVDISDQSTVKKGLGFVPEGISAFSFALGVGHERGGELQNVLFAVEIGEGVVVHGFSEIDGIEDLDAIVGMDEGISHLQERCAFWQAFFCIDEARYLFLEIACFNILSNDLPELLVQGDLALLFEVQADYNGRVALSECDGRYRPLNLNILHNLSFLSPCAWRHRAPDREKGVVGFPCKRKRKRGPKHSQTLIVFIVFLLVSFKSFIAVYMFTKRERPKKARYCKASEQLTAVNGCKRDQSYNHSLGSSICEHSSSDSTLNPSSSVSESFTISRTQLRC